jgi:hypothetical protein
MKWLRRFARVYRVPMKNSYDKKFFLGFEPLF